MEQIGGYRQVVLRIGGCLDFLLLLVLYTQFPANSLDSVNSNLYAMEGKVFLKTFRTIGFSGLFMRCTNCYSKVRFLFPVLKLLTQLAKVDFGKDNLLAASSTEWSSTLINLTASSLNSFVIPVRYSLHWTPLLYIYRTLLWYPLFLTDLKSAWNSRLLDQV